MMTRLFKRYLQIPLINKLIAAFILGSFFGMLSWYGEVQANLSMQDVLKNYVSPFGTIFIQMLKMVVIPIVFVVEVYIQFCFGCSDQRV